MTKTIEKLSDGKTYEVMGSADKALYFSVKDTDLILREVKNDMPEIQVGDRLYLHNTTEQHYDVICKSNAFKDAQWITRGSYTNDLVDVHPSRVTKIMRSGSIIWSRV